jgi:hypothetical protein
METAQAARPFTQHVVSPATRLTPYEGEFRQSAIPFPCGSSQGERESSEPVFDHDQSEREFYTSRNELRALRTAATGNDYWHDVHADAVRTNPDILFKGLKKRRKRQSQKGSTSDADTEPSLGYRVRRASNQGDEDPPVESEEGNFVNADIDIPLPETNMSVPVSERPLSNDFNVTAETQYNVSVSVSHGSNSTNDTVTAVYTQNEQTNKTVVPPFRPIRIRAFLSETDGGGVHLSEAQHQILLQDTVRPALLAWSAALRVNPVVGNLTIDPTQLVDGVSCGPGLDSGLPSVPVPDEHILWGVPNTDLIIYLNLGFVPSNPQNVTDSWNVSGTNASIFSEGPAVFPSKPKRYFDKSELVIPRNETTNETVSEQWNASFVATYNMTSTVPKKTCQGDYLAASSFCTMDQKDRPTAAILHICISENFFDPLMLETNILTVMHELGHALGFNSVSMALFRTSDGTPLTPRNEKGAVPDTVVECSGPKGNRGNATVPLPSAKILQFREVRGGVRVAEIVTPSVQKVVRNHFDCQGLQGAELESGEFLPLSTSPGEVSCIGDHWERRLFKNDILNPIVDELEFHPRFSTITLAYFADTGWYQVDLSRASLAASWGRGAGCAFVEEACIRQDGQVPPSYEPFFCNQATSIDDAGFVSDISGCTPDLSRKAACSIGQYTNELPREYQYFNLTFGANVGGNDPFMDYCPVFTGFSNGLCSDSQNEALIRVNQVERFGQRNSRCLSGRVGAYKAAFCLPIACVVEDHSLRIQVDGEWKKCLFKDHHILSSNGDRIICPDPIRICPTFYCHRDCLGTDRICNYREGKCVCNGTFAPADDGVSCTTPVEPSGVIPAVFYSPPTMNNQDLPDEDSPLADYYVPSERALKEDNPIFIEEIRYLVVVAVIFALGIVAFIWIWLRRNRAFDTQLADGGADDSPPTDATHNPNKDKMIASVIVDLRVNGPSQSQYRDALRERESETDVSLTDTEGTGFTNAANSAENAGAGASIFGLHRAENEAPQGDRIIRRRRYFQHQQPNDGEFGA